MTEDVDDVLMVSLTDTLTCVLAASIALFLIFVVFAKLVPAEVQGGTVSKSRLMSRAEGLRSLNNRSLKLRMPL